VAKTADRTVKSTDSGTCNAIGNGLDEPLDSELPLAEVSFVIWVEHAGSQILQTLKIYNQISTPTSINLIYKNIHKLSGVHKLTLKT
jgi:hypothetical protein